MVKQSLIVEPIELGPITRWTTTFSFTLQSDVALAAAAAAGSKGDGNDAFIARAEAILATMQKDERARSPLKPLSGLLGLGQVMGVFPAFVGEQAVNFEFRPFACRTW